MRKKQTPKFIHRSSRGRTPAQNARRRTQDQALRFALNQGASPLGHTILSISVVNLKRALRWHRGGLDNWTVLEWAGAMAGEAGETCNAAKRLRRLEQNIRQRKGPTSLAEARSKLATEIGDTYLYLDLLCSRAGINFRQAIIDTFNRVSEREGFPERL
jgi:NTP pyrophosphatase (non-canonical NTP hydrolase)